MRRLLSTCALLMMIVASVRAHPAPFSYLELRLEEDGASGSLVVHDFDVAHDLGVESPSALLDPAIAQAHRERLVSLLNTRLRLRFDGALVPMVWGDLAVLPDRQSIRIAFVAAGRRPGALAIDAHLFPYDPVHQTFINVYEGGQLRHQTILHADRRTVDYYAGTAQGAWAVVRTFVPVGVEHILIGPDHVLFLIGLLLLGGSVWRLATIVTAFTAGHSVTLSLAALDLVTPPSSIVEPTIALSIVFVGADNLLVGRMARRGDSSSSVPRAEASGSAAWLKPRTRVRENRVAPRDIRPWVAAVFGLVHGFGFASVLKDFGLPASSLAWSLFSFNAGVEIGQLLIVALVASALEAIRRHSALTGDRLVLAGSVLVILAGGYWFVQRVFLTGGSS
ncbi:MAG: HupE/UreJ family protein [Acidobacteria bacterium]|nr:HupE/UreJ family protein [Acidobacteriota bacterium]